MLQEMAKDVIALAVLFIYSICVFGLGWGIAITYEASAIKMQRDVWSLVDIMKDDPVPPGYETCTSDPVENHKNFVIKLCKVGTTQKDYLADKAKWH
jgi:hypothetical protein